MRRATGERMRRWTLGGLVWAMLLAGGCDSSSPSGGQDGGADGGSDGGVIACTVAADCDDGNPCTDDSCGEQGVCQHRHNTAACDDGDACTADDACNAGVCGGTPVDCDDGNPCTDDACVADSGCVHDNNEAPCDDGDACTEGDVCADGVCTPGTNTCDCQRDADCAQYEDGDRCNGTLICVDHACEVDPATVVECDPAGDTVCMRNTCQPDSGDCVMQAEPDGTICDDGDACTADDACSGGQCSGGPLDCDDGDACTADSCDPASGCLHDAVSCDDGDACTADSCDPASGCVHDAIGCDDGDACTADSCDPASGCVHDAIGCDDGDACTADSCDPATGCVHDAVSCDDGDACTADSCDPATGCINAAISCDDGDACTADSCDPATGCVHDAVSCDDGDACTADSCDPATGCVNVAIGCDDDDACTADSCDPASGCVNAAISCDDGDACTLDSCDPATGCTTQPRDCDDGDACTVDGCDPATGCTTQPLDCSDGDACTQDLCDPASGCSNPAVDCNDDNVCTDDLCDPASGCYYENNTAPCDDGDPCTEPDVCSGGLCLSGPDICGGTNAALLVYMAADNNLDSYGLSDWQEMEAAGVDAADWLRVFVLIDRHSSGGWSDSRLYEVHSGSSTELDGPHLGISAGASAEELDMADPATLSAFLQDVRDITGADWEHYLVVWNHGGGWRGESMNDDPNTVLKEVCQDESSGDYLYTAELQSAVAGHGLALIGFDACLEGMAEVAYELRNDAQVMIGSEENEPGDGWEYDGLLSQFMALGAPDPVAFGQIVVDTYMDSMDYDDMTLASFDLTALDALAVACDGMATALDGWSNQYWNSLCGDNSLEWFGVFWPFFDPHITDLGHLAARAEAIDPANAAAYQAVAAAVDQVVLYERHRADHPNAHGLSIYFGCNGAAADYDASQIQWAADTLWDDVLHAR